MTEQPKTQSSQKGTVAQDVSKEVGSLKTEIQSLTTDIRERINAAGDEAKQTWSKLDAERKRFMDKVEQAAEETGSDVRQMGNDLKRRLQGLRQELQAGGGKQKSSQSGASSSASK
ncbi:MAG: hypothetical protein WAU39_06740 [Polyangiales bacterium]